MGTRKQRSIQRRQAEATLRIGATRALPAVLRSLGKDPAAILAEVGIEPALFDNPGNRISYAARNRLVAHCVARTGCQHLGLLVGSQGGLQSLGLLGLLVKYSPDVGTALRNLARYLPYHARGAVVTLEIDDDLAVLGYEVYLVGVDATDHVGDGAVAVMFNCVRALCGPDWKPVEVRFAHRKPMNIEPFRAFFRAPLRFDAEQNALVFAADWLGRRAPDADPELLQLMQEKLNALDVHHDGKLPDEVRSVLRTALLSGHANSDQVAAQFSMHSRTLNRRLKDFGTGFRQLVDESRLEISRQMLRDSALEITRIATSLGYADSSAFTRAFRRWTGTTPAQWRAARQPR